MVDSISSRIQLNLSTIRCLADVRVTCESSLLVARCTLPSQVQIRTAYPGHYAAVQEAKICKTSTNFLATVVASWFGMPYT